MQRLNSAIMKFFSSCTFRRLLTVAVWSHVNVAGTRLMDILPGIGEPNDPEDWDQVHKDVINRYGLLPISDHPIRFIVTYYGIIFILREFFVCGMSWQN